MNKEELARRYADKKVEEKKEYPLCDIRRRKVLTSFNGCAIEIAYEDGFDKAVEKAVEWIYQQQLSVPNIDEFINGFKKYMED